MILLGNLEQLTVLGRPSALPEYDPVDRGLLGIFYVVLTKHCQLFNLHPLRPPPLRVHETLAGKRKEGSKMAISSAQELFVHELGEIYDAENRLIEGQQEMVEHATDQDLKSAIQQHLEQTRQHAVNVERVFSDLDQEAHRETNEVAQGLVSEAREGIQEAQSDALRDAAIVSAVIEVEHFEMGSYRSLVTAANLMGQSEIERLLRENMQQEEETARIAEQSAEELLSKAMQEGDQGGEEGLINKAKDKLTGR
jgi:ferritin-like metal-binding protein YciE